MSGDLDGHPPLRIELRDDLAELARVDQEAKSFLQGRGIDDLRIYRARLVLEEVISNAIRHGCNDGRRHRIAVDVAADARTVVIRVVDDGAAFDPTTAPAFDAGAALEARSRGGMGIHLVRSVARTVRYERRADRNCLEVTL